MALRQLKRIPKSLERFSDKMRVKTKALERLSDSIRSKRALMFFSGGFAGCMSSALPDGNGTFSENPSYFTLVKLALRLLHAILVGVIC
ncbi:hypothetical protein HED55_24385 [Ochrobactrum haematophilum]|uniref:Uncharacterized protein n=1 Tax=Brucella haematophila TaxID=419474 RepID=A0ABX1DQE4_9HYPH|nr:hypothetical protein [Brucella haematophila]